MKMVIADNYQQYSTYLREAEVEPYDDVHYVSDVHKLLGCDITVTIVLYGTWYRRKDVYELMEYIKCRGLKVESYQERAV